MTRQAVFVDGATFPAEVFTDPMGRLICPLTDTTGLFYNRRICAWVHCTFAPDIVRRPISQSSIQALAQALYHTLRKATP